jgi:hypothetical protein
VDWMHLAEYRDNWWAFVNTVMNVPILLFTIVTLHDMSYNY